MSDEALVDIGDELVVRIAGYPVGKATVEGISFNGNFIAKMYDGEGRYIWTFYLPPDFKEHDVTDGVAHSLTKGNL